MCYNEKYLEKIFQPFERLDWASAVEGTGMGLAICKKVAVCHGGEITAVSQPQNGATFIIKLPERHAVK